MTAPSQKKMMLFGGRAFPELADEVADCMGIEPTPAKLFDFANGEIFVRFLESVRGCDAFVLQSHTAPINQWIMEQLIMVDALKRASAKRITVVMRRSSATPGRTRRAGAGSRSRRGSWRTCSPRRGPTGSWPSTCTPRRSRGSSTGRWIICSRCRSWRATWRPSWTSERHRGRAGRGAGPGLRALDRPAWLPLAIIHKRRDPDVANQVKDASRWSVRSRGGTCILVDDMIDTGGDDREGRGRAV